MTRLLDYSLMNHVALAVSNTNTLMLSMTDDCRVKMRRYDCYGRRTLLLLKAYCNRGLL